MVAGDGTLHLEFVRPQTGEQFALFVGSSSTGLLVGAPAAVDPAGTTFALSGLTNGQRLRAALAVRTGPSDPWVRSGPILTGRPGPVVFVDPGADPGVADGTSPATAFDDPELAAIVAAGSGANVWMLGGDYGPQAITLASEVALHGGFVAGFDPAARRPLDAPSVLRGTAGSPMVTVLFGGTDAICDGLALEGDGVAPIGVDGQDTPLELRSLTVRGCTDRGVRLRGPLSGDPTSLVLARVDLFANGADGLSVVGSFDAELFASRFLGNAQEGAEFDDLVADSGRAARLVVDGCTFAGNASEGLDVDLVASLGATPPGGTFDVVVRESTFASNGLTGLLVDIDYESLPQWSANIEVVGCVARANRGSGVLLDLDSTQSSFVHRCRLESNEANGLVVASETAPGLTVVSSCYVAGNGGAGILADQGNVAVAASHCAFVANATAGMRTTGPRVSVASCVEIDQPAAFVGVDVFGSGAANSTELDRLPFEFLRATANGVDGLTVDESNLVQVGDLAEVAADGVSRDVTAIVGSRLVLDPAVGEALLPTTVALFAPPGDVEERLGVQPGATVSGIGLAPVGGPSVDPGPSGSPEGGDPGPIGSVVGERSRVAAVEPASLTPLASGALVRIHFDRALLGPSADAVSVRTFDGAGAAVSAGIAVVGGALELTAPVGGWPSELRLELDRGLEAVDGAPLAAPIVLVWR